MSCYTGISAGWQHSLALLKDGRVTGWGWNIEGQTTIPVGIGTNATGISAGYGHSLALLKDGRVTGWGRNVEGQTTIPAGIGNNATGISAGWYYSLALLKDGRVTGWGENLRGQITIPVGIGNNATGISAGWQHSLALLKDGRVTGWGLNEYGQITIPVGIGTNATGISAGWQHSLALLKDGRVTGWGWNNVGQIDIPAGIGNNAVGISAGDYHSLALLKDGTVTGWGSNSLGETTIPVGIGNNAVGIGVGHYNSLALLKDGRVTGWGNNQVGQNNIPACPKLNQTITFPSIPTKTFGDASFNLGVTSTNNTISITYTSSNANVATVSSNGTVSIVGVGTTIITASQAGDSNYNAATPVSQTLTVNKANQTITFNALASRTFGNAPFALTATASSNLTISYTSSNTSVATVAGNVVTIVGGGATTITASQVGDSNYNAATPVTQTLTVNKANQTITFNALASRTFGNAPFSLTATASSNLGVSYTSSNTSVATVAGNVVTIVGVGATTITASQVGDSNYNAATPVSQTLTVNKANQTITFNALASRTFGNAPFALTATASSNLTISYTSSNTSVATVAGNIVTIVGVGATTITASQVGDSNYNAATPVTQTLAVNKADQTITFPSIPNLRVFNTYFLNATASSNLPVTYSIDFPNIANITDFILFAKEVGIATITASQAGNVNFNPAPSVTRSLIVTRIVPIITNITTSPAYIRSRLSDIQISATTSVPGIIYWSNPSYELTSLGQQTYTAIFVPNDPVNYENVNLNITINVLSNPWKLLLVDELPLKLNGVNANFSTAYSSEYNSNYLLINGRPVYYYKDDPNIYTVNGYSISRKIFDKNGNIF